MKFESIIGQERPLRFLSQIVKKQRIPNALLFTGIDGIGKQTTARTFAMLLNCADPVDLSPCESCPSCRKFMSGSHPDIISVEPQGAFIKIDQVRGLSRQLRFAPLEGGWRVVIINDAHAMNLEASNAILKMLEEPPKGTILILTATQTSDLLPTIVSRCQQVPFSPIPYGKVARVLVEQKGLEQETASTLALCSKGSLGKACAIDAEKGPLWRADLLKQVSALSLDAIQPLLALADKLSRDKARLGDGLDVIMTWFRDVLMSQIAPHRIINKDFMEEIERASKGRPVSELIRRFEAVHKTLTAISQNANPRLALEVMMLHVCSGGPSRKGMQAAPRPGNEARKDDPLHP